jgi:hypothetical protein
LSDVIGETTVSTTRITRGLESLAATQEALGRASRNNVTQAGEMERIVNRFVTGDGTSDRDDFPAAVSGSREKTAAGE